MSEDRPRRRRNRPERRADQDLSRASRPDERAAAPALAETGADHPRHGDLDAHELPHATLAPITMAAGIALLGFGVLTSPLFSVVGIAIMGWALWTWIGEMRHG